MSKFKVGDMVRILHTDYPETDLQIGKIVEVFNSDDDGCELIGTTLETGNTTNLFFYDHELELVEPEQETSETSREIKVGDTVERVSGKNNTTPIGFRGVVSEIIANGDWAPRLIFDDEKWGYERESENSPVSNWKIIEPANDSPVIYETVRKAKIVPGEYGDVRLGVVSSELGTSVHVAVDSKWYTKDQLAKIIETLTTIHKAMEEGLMDDRMAHHNNACR